MSNKPDMKNFISEQLTSLLTDKLLSSIDGSSELSKHDLYLINFYANEINDWMKSNFNLSSKNLSIHRTWEQNLELVSDEVD